MLVIVFPFSQKSLTVGLLKSVIIIGLLLFVILIVLSLPKYQLGPTSKEFNSGLCLLLKLHSYESEWIVLNYIYIAWHLFAFCVLVLNYISIYITVAQSRSKSGKTSSLTKIKLWTAVFFLINILTFVPMLEKEETCLGGNCKELIQYS